MEQNEDAGTTPAPRKSWHVLTQLIGEHLLSLDRGEGDTINCVEIGVKSGRTMSEILPHFLSVHWTAVDPWVRTAGYTHWSSGQIARHEAKFDAVAALYSDRVLKVKSKSAEAITLFDPGTVDLVFIDGDHSYEGVKQDITLYLPTLRPGGILAGHGYGHERFPGVAQAVDELGMPGVQLEEDHVWWVTAP